MKHYVVAISDIYAGMHNIFFTEAENSVQAMYNLLIDQKYKPDIEQMISIKFKNEKTNMESYFLNLSDEKFKEECIILDLMITAAEIPAANQERLSVVLENVCGEITHYLILDNKTQVAMTKDTNTFELDFSDSALVENAELELSDAQWLRDNLFYISKYLNTKGFKVIIK